MNLSTAMAERLGVDLHADARDVTAATVNYEDRSIPAVWAPGRGVIADKAVNYQAVRHGGGILEDHTPVEYGPTRDDWHSARRFRTRNGTVVTLAERNYLASRTNGVDALIEDILHDSYDAAHVPGTVKGTSVRHTLSITKQQRQVNDANLRNLEFAREHGTAWYDKYNTSVRTVRVNGRTVSVPGGIRNYTGTYRDGVAPNRTRVEHAATILHEAQMAGRVAKGVKCLSHPDGNVHPDEACGTCKPCKGREYTARSRAKQAEKQRIEDERKLAKIGGDAEWQ